MIKQKRLKPWIKHTIEVVAIASLSYGFLYALGSNPPHDDRLHYEGVDANKQQELTDQLKENKINK